MKFLIATVAIVLLSGCISFGKDDTRITSAVESIIEQERTNDLTINIPILEVFMIACTKPIRPIDNTMGAYEVALRDAIVSFMACNNSYEELKEQVRLKQEIKDGG